MKKWLLIVGCLATVIAYQNCSARHETLEGAALNTSEEGTTSNDVDMVKSLVAYERTLFPITQVESQCVGCHGESQQPLFALADSSLSHDILLSFGMVNLRDPGSSKIVQKIEGGHNGFPTTLAADILAAIQDWSDELVANGGLVGVGDGVQPTFASISENILEPKCVSCHGPDGEVPSIDYSSYLQTYNTGMLDPGSAATSGLYIHTLSGQEPRGGEDALLPEELNALRDWINRGALDN